MERPNKVQYLSKYDLYAVWLPNQVVVVEAAPFAVVYFTGLGVSKHGVSSLATPVHFEKAGSL